MARALRGIRDSATVSAETSSNWSDSTLRRVQRLRMIGAIEREVAIISSKVESRRLVIVVLMTIDGHNPRIMDEFCHRLRRQSVVDRLIWVTGEDDIVIVLHCASMEEFDEFAQEYINDAPVIGYKTLVSMREY